MILLNFCKETKQTCFCAINKQKTFPSTWVSLQLVGTMLIWTLAPRDLRKILWSSLSFHLTWTFFIRRALFLQNLIFTYCWNRFTTNYLCKSAARNQNALQQKSNLVIQSVNLIIRTKKLTSTNHNALINIVVSQNIVHYKSRVEMKHLAIPANQTYINFDNFFLQARYYIKSWFIWLATPMSRVATRETRIIF